MKKNVVIRVDAANAMGRGHVMRCLSLADAVRRWSGEVMFICRQLKGDLIEFIQSQQYIVHTFSGNDDAQETIKILKNITTIDTLVVDHYGLDSAWEKLVRSYVNRIVVLDDLANRAHDCDILIDPGLCRNPGDYQDLVPTNCLLLLGPAYAPLSPMYSKLRYQALDRRRAPQKIENILISMGGTDPNNATCFILKALSQLKLSLSLNVVVGSSWKYLPDLKKIIEKSHHQVQLHTHVSNLAELMLLSDLAIGAGGTTSYERCSLALPSLTIMIADNQRHNVHALQQKNAATFLGSAGEVSPDVISNAVSELIKNSEQWRRMSEAASQVCDGYGANRIAAQLLSEPNDLLLRPIVAEVVEIIFQWQQDPSTREYARHSAAPSKSEHEAWFQQRLRNPDCLFNMIVNDQAPVGVLRLDRLKDKGNTFEISILIAPQHRKKGFAASALRLVRKVFPSLSFYAEVHPDNKASHQLFQSTGYIFQETGYYNDDR